MCCANFAISFLINDLGLFVICFALCKFVNCYLNKRPLLRLLVLGNAAPRIVR
jgi:hypothetical protein